MRYITKLFISETKVKIVPALRKVPPHEEVSLA
jgi:hypothetical protein